MLQKHKSISKVEALAKILVKVADVVSVLQFTPFIVKSLSSIQLSLAKHTKNGRTSDSITVPTKRLIYRYDGRA